MKSSGTSHPRDTFLTRTKIGSRHFYVKCPPPEEIQLRTIAKYFIRVRHPRVYRAKQYDVKFEEKLDVWKKRPFCKRYPELERRHRDRDGIANITPLCHGEYDFDGALTHKSFCMEMLKKTNNTLMESVTEWERKHWKKRYCNDVRAEEVYEVIGNFAMVTLREEASTSFRPIYSICLETSRACLKNHEWVNISRGLCGMLPYFKCKSIRAKQMTGNSGATFLCTVGFLVAINSCKDDMTVLKNLMMTGMNLFQTLPTWWVVQLSLWLIQKGFVKEARTLIEEYAFEKLPQHFQTILPKTADNPKKEMTIFLCNLINAVFLYCEWKLEVLKLNDENEDDINFSFRESLRRKGEAALNAYEMVYDKYELVNAEAMCFLPPFVELVVEFRSVSRANDIVREVFIENDGNMYVEQYYVQFLEQYSNECGVSADEIAHLKDRFESKFTYTVSKKVSVKGKRQIRAMKDKKSESDLGSFQQIEHPGFSW